MDNQPAPRIVNTVEEIFGEMARHIEASIDAAAGWDEPASLWMIDTPEDHDDDLPGLAFRVRFDRVLDGHPFFALVGVRAPRSAVGVAVVTEGWAHSEENLARMAAGEQLDAPSTYPDRRELRLVHLTMRDGTEVLVQRRRGEPAAEILLAGARDDTRIGGRVAWAIRRVLELPSRAETTASPSELFARMLLTPIVAVLVTMYEQCGVRAARRVLTDLLADGMEQYVEQATETVRTFADVHHWWRTGLGAPISLASDDRYLRELLDWGDADLVAHHLETQMLTLEETSRCLRELRDREVLQRAEEELLRRIFPALGR